MWDRMQWRWKCGRRPSAGEGRGRLPSAGKEVEGGVPPSKVPSPLSTPLPITISNLLLSTGGVGSGRHMGRIGGDMGRIGLGRGGGVMNVGGGGDWGGVYLVPV